MHLLHRYMVLDFSSQKPQRLCANLSLDEALEFFKKQADSPQVALVREEFFGQGFERELLIRLVSEQNEQLGADVEARAGDRELLRTDETRRHLAAAQKAAANRSESRDAELNYQLALFNVYRHLLEMWEANKVRDRELEQRQAQDIDLGR